METLKLGWCKIGAEKGAQAIADLLMYNQSLVSARLTCQHVVHAELMLSACLCSIRRRHHTVLPPRWRRSVTSSNLSIPDYGRW